MVRTSPDTEYASVVSAYVPACLDRFTVITNAPATSASVPCPTLTLVSVPSKRYTSAPQGAGVFISVIVVGEVVMTICFSPPDRPPDGLRLASSSRPVHHDPSTDKSYASIPQLHLTKSS